MARHGGPVTIRQVALHARVSRQTVSNVLNAPERVDPATRLRVRSAIEALGYRPNRNARNLATRRTGLIGYCLPVRGTPNSFMDRFLHLLTAEVERSGRHVLLFTGTDGDARLDAYADLVAQRAVDAFVLADTVDRDERHQWLADRDVPFVSFGRTWARRQPGPWVDLDGAGACHRLVHGLHDLGRSRVAFVGQADATGQYLDRMRGWRTGCDALDLPSDRFAFADADTVEAGGRAMRSLLDSEVPPDAVIAVSDPIAVGVLREVRRQGLRPGTDVAVTGFDDTPLASVVDGGLTSVRQPVERFARTVVDLLDGANGDGGVLLPGEIISRGSAPVRLTEQDEIRWEFR